jgi:tetratricopeptide (TPR) repeat protein
MRRFASGALAAAATIAGIALAAITLRAREEHFALAPVRDRFLYLRSGRTADRLALSFDSLAADVYWVRTIQHYGRDYKNRARAGRFELLEPLLDLTTTLDPHFLIAYRFGAIFLALAPPDGPGRPDQAIALLEKGVAANPQAWQLAHDIAFTHYLYTGDYQAAADWFRKAAAMPGAPEWIGPLAAATVARGGDRQGARQMLRELGNAQEEYVRSAAERTLAQLAALDQIDELHGRIELFRSRTGRDPSGWPEMIAAGLIPSVPLDPAGVPFTYDAATRTATFGPSSRLLPLPPMLQPK